MKRFIYMLILILLALLFSAMFSPFGADKLLFYTFFFFISAFMCGLKPMPVLLLFFVAEWFVTESELLYSLQLFVFVLGVCISFRKLKLYPAAILGYTISLAICALFQVITKENILMIFDKWYLYLISFIAAQPFVFAMMRAGIVNRKRG